MLHAPVALLPDGWGQDVLISIGERGLIQSVEVGITETPTGAERLAGVLVPGVPNCHSHAFQRAMVGLAEKRGGDGDNFWSWRDAMYRAMGKIGPEQLQAIAEQLYIEMMKQGYTSVAEFHYLHHAPNGQPYDDPAEMSRRLIAAANTAGIHITLLPVLYCHSDFGGVAPEAAQRRFIHALEDYQRLLERLQRYCLNLDNVHLGMALHSLRAVSEPLLRDAIAILDGLDPSAPIHIHIAEQQREVEQCIAHTGARPVEWLLDHFEVDSRWCLVHATHVTDAECQDLVRSGAVAGLCPATEANLGDGLFPATDYFQAGGRMAVGSDSQVSVDPAQELRLLEYGQRLQRQQRTLMATASIPSVGESLLRAAVRGGSQALGIQAGRVQAGARADLLVLDSGHPRLLGRQESEILDSWIFGCQHTPVKDVMVAGRWQVRDTVHPRQDEIIRRFREAL